MTLNMVIQHLIKVYRKIITVKLEIYLIKMVVGFQNTELRLASALYNVDIRIYLNTGEQYLIESKHNRAVFTEGKGI